MSDITVGARVRSLRDSVFGVERLTGYLGRTGTVVDARHGWPAADVQWDDDADGPWFWPIDDLEVVEGEEG